MIERWNSNETIMFSHFNQYIDDDLSMKEKPIDIWRDKIKNCKFDCWDCNYCENVITSHMKKQNMEQHPFVDMILESINSSACAVSNFDESTFDISGLSSNRVRHLLNSLCSNEGIKYLKLVHILEAPSVLQ